MEQVGTRLRGFPLVNLRGAWKSGPHIMSDRIILLQRAQTLWREARQVRVEAARLVLSTDKECLQELAAIHSTDVVLPTATVPQRELRLRCVVRPDRDQAALIDRLGLRLPERLRMHRA